MKSKYNLTYKLKILEKAQGLMRRRQKYSLTGFLVDFIFTTLLKNMVLIPNYNCKISGFHQIFSCIFYTKLRLVRVS